jgi:hypothetical protein
MRKTLLLSLLLCLLLSFYIFAQNQESFRKEAIKRLWKDTVGLDAKGKESRKIQIQYQIKGVSKIVAFPDTTFAFVAFYRAKKYEMFGDDKLIQKTPTGLRIHHTMYLPHTVLLTDNQVNRLLNIVNNPSNFHWAECGTPFINGGFVFYNKQGQIVAYMAVGCSFTSFYFSKTNIMAKYGGLEETKEFFKLLDEMFGK